MATFPISFGDPGISGSDISIGTEISQGGGIGSGPDIYGVPINPPVGTVATPSNGGGFWGDLSNLVSSATKVYSTYEQGNLLSQQIKAGQTPSIGVNATTGALQPAVNTAAGQLTSLLGGSNSTLWILILLAVVVMLVRR